MVSPPLRLGLLLAFASLLQAQSSDRTLAVPGSALPGVTASPQVAAQVEAFRKVARERGWTFTPRITSASSRPLANLTGELPTTAAELKIAPAVTKQGLRLWRSYSGLLRRQNPGLRIACNADLPSWDWRAHGKVTPPKDQACGDCWAFASAGQIESAMLMAGWSQEDLSEQHILDCSNSGTCTGGGRWDALPWAIGTAVARESQYSYAGGAKKECKANIAGPAKLLAAGWVDTSGTVPPPAKLKAALCEYGPISVSFRATSLFRHYGGDENEVFNENDTGETNHAVLLVGWSDSKQAWLMKNSWGSKWGWGGGYAWIRYGSNSIGRKPFWATARSPSLRLTPKIQRDLRVYEDLLKQLKPPQLRPPRPPKPPRPDE